MPSILITGANGFIGSNLCRHFLDQGWVVHGLVRESSDLHFIKGLPVRLVRGDLREAATIVFPARVDCIIHAASVVSDIVGLEGSISGIYEPTVRFVEALRVQGVSFDRFVYISTSLVLGWHRLDIHEEHPGRPTDHIPYARAKRQTEEFLLERHRAEGLPLVILRPADVYGPNDRTSLSMMLEGIEGGISPIVGTGRHRFSYCYVANLCQACRLVAEGRGAAGAAYTVTNGEDVTWGEFFTALMRRLGKRRWIYWPVSLAYLVALVMQLLHHLLPSYVLRLSVYRINRITTDSTYDIAKTVRELGYAPEHDLERQADAIVAWYREEKRTGHSARLIRRMT
jgi:nucleoside-diphosphate-sugar epimerase